MVLKNEERLKLVNINIREMINYLQNLDEYTIRWNPGVEKWSIMQIAIHVCDAIPFWSKQFDKAINDPTSEIGRGHFDKGRLIAISKENVNNTSIKEVISDLEKIPPLVKKSLESLTEKQLQDETVQFIADIEIVQHIEIHVHQIKRNLSDKAKFDFNQGT